MIHLLALATLIAPLCITAGNFDDEFQPEHTQSSNIELALKNVKELTADYAEKLQQKTETAVREFPATADYTQQPQEQIIEITQQPSIAPETAQQPEALVVESLAPAAPQAVQETEILAPASQPEPTPVVDTVAPQQAPRISYAKKAQTMLTSMIPSLKTVGYLTACSAPIAAFVYWYNLPEQQLERWLQAHIRFCKNQGHESYKITKTIDNHSATFAYDHTKKSITISRTYGSAIERHQTIA